MTLLTAEGASTAASPGRRDRPAASLLFAVAYFAGSELGYSLSLGPTVGGTFWPPSGISLGVLLVAPMHAWPWLLAGGAAANFGSDLLHGQTLPASIGFAIANLGEPLLGAYVLRRFLPAPLTCARLPEMIALAVVVVAVSTPAAAAIGALTAQWYTQNPPDFASGWRTWWVGDAVGGLVLTPVVVRVMRGWRRLAALPTRLWLEAAAFGVCVWAVTHVVFSAPPTALAMPFLVFPVLLWGSVRLGPVAVGGALCLVVVLTARDTAAGAGPFAADHLSLGDRLVALQIYVGVMALSFYGLAVLWEERARTAAALRLAHSGLEARYRRIVEQSPFGILALKRGGGVQDVNPAWRRLWTPASTRNELPSGTQPWNDAQLEPLLARAFAGEVVELPEREVEVRSDAVATRRRVQGFAYPIKDETDVVGEVVLIERDVTDEIAAREQLLAANRTLREREEALSHALAQMADAQAHREQLLEAERSARAEAERASLLKDEFLATLSHELRTPLNAIVGWAQILRRNSRDPALAQAVETIDRNARAQAKLIDDLLDMSRILAGKVGLTVARVRLADIVAAAADALQPLADAHEVRLVVDGEGPRDVWVSGDTARLQQVVTNLLGNGVKFTPAGGVVETRVAAHGTEAHLVVRDTGQGIHADFLPTVFERFRQADGSTTRRHDGLGLGLSIAKHIVEMHGGSIRAHSDGPGLGATFTVTIPLADGAAPALDSPAALVEGRSLAALRVLVVDDHADARELLRRLLVEQECNVACASSADEALRALAAVPFDVLLTDIGMPGADGYELLRRVRARRGPYLRTIAVTAFARPEDRNRAMAAGFDGHLSKPVDAAQLLQTLARIVAAPAPAPADTAPPPGSDAETIAG